MSKLIQCPTPAEYDAKVAEAKSAASKVFLLFTGAKDASGRSWCGDCTRAEPIIMKVLADATDSVVLECPCERTAYRAKDTFPYRLDKSIKLTCVPTLMSLDNPAIRLDDSQCQNEDLVRELMLED
jgi:hypothetical protein